MRDAIDFKKGNVAAMFRHLFMPALLGTVAMSVVAAIYGICSY